MRHTTWRNAVKGSRRSAFQAAFGVTMGALIIAITATLAQAANNPINLGLSIQSGEVPLLIDTENQLGRQVDTVRMFSRWDDAFPSDQDLATLDGRNGILSIRPQDGNTQIPWADIAAAQPGDPLHDDMVAWANAIEPYEDQLWITFNHEPEAASNLAHGDADDFIAAWQTFMTVLEDNGVESLGRTWITTNFAHQVSDNDRRSAPKWYPGDEWVDVIAADAYNWYTCRPNSPSPWDELEPLIEDFRLFGQAHPDQQLMLAEFGTVEDPADPTRKAQWFANAQALFAEPGYEQFVTVSYFNLNDDSGTFQCDWRFDSSPESQAGFVAFANDEFYGGGVNATPPPTTTTTTAPVGPTDCVATPNGAGFDLSWTETGTANVRRNGAWLARVANGATTYFDPSPSAGSTYVIRVRGANGVLNLACSLPPTVPTTTTTTTTVAPTTTTTTTTTVAPPPPDAVCVATVDGNTVTLEWDLQDRNIIRRNGAWRATAADGETTFVDTNAPTDATYVIRNRPAGGGFVDYECVQSGDVALPPPPIAGCTITIDGQGATLTWGFDDRAIIRKNGNWLATVSVGQTFTDPNGTAADSYLLRTWPAGGMVDYTC